MSTRIAKWLGLRRPGTSLQMILTYPFVSLILITVILTGLFSFYHSGKAIDNMAGQLMDKITAQVQDRIMLFLDRAHLVNEINANAIEAGQIDPKKTTPMEVHFWNQVRSFEYISYSYLGSAEGGFWGARRLANGTLQIIATATPTGGEIFYFNSDDSGRRTDVSRTIPSYDHKTRPWYKAALQAGKPTWSPVFVDAGGEGLTITAAKPLYDVAGNMKGVLGSSFIFSHINQFLRSLKMGESGQTFIIERSGVLVATSTSDPTSTADKKRIAARESENPLIAHASQSITERFGNLSGIDRAQRLSVDMRGERYFLHLTPFHDGRGIDWLIAVIVPENYFMSSIKESQRNTILLSLIALILTIMAGFMISRRITKPILELNRAAKSLASGEWSQDIEIGRRDEIGELAKSFNLMARQLRDAIENLEQKVAERTAEIMEISRKHLASEKKYRELYENLRDGSAMVDMEENITEFNTAFQNLIGYTAEEIHSLKFTDITPARWQVVEKEILTEQVFKRGYSDPYEKEYIRKDGTIFPVELSTYLVRDENNNPSRFWVFVRNISERKRAEEALKESENWYRTIFENTGTATVILDENTTIILANAEYEKLSGYAKNELEGKKSWTDFVVQEDLDRMIASHKQRRIDREAALKSYEFQFKDQKGNIKNIFLTIDMIPGTRRSVASLLDVTELKRVDEERLRLVTAIEQAAEGIYLTDTNWIIRYANPAFERMLGYDKGEMVGWHAGLLKSGKHDRIFYQNIRETLISGKVWSGKGINKKKDGTFVDVDITMSPVRERSGNIINYVCIHRDITREIALETQLIQAQKLESLGTLAGGIAHDFNNLLMGIQGYASLSLMNIDPSHPNYERLKRIEDQVQSGADLTKQLLGFARGGRYEVKPTDMNDILEKSSSMFGRTKKEISIYRKFGKDLWIVEADRGQLEQVFLNLYVNAWQAMPGGGEIYLETEKIILDDEQAFFYAVKPGRYVKISMTDTGTGMDARTQERIFDPFFTTKDMGRGTGLGLATVYGIIKGHGGLINVYSEPGHGTTFIIYLPASEKEVVKEKTSPGTIAKGTETILLVDDEKMVLEVSKELLESMGYRVYAVGSGQEALALYMEKKSEVDLVILDMIMPGISGGETFDRLHEINPGIKVLLSSGYSINGKAQIIMDRGCNGFLQKPFQLENLSRKIREVLDD